MSILKNFTYFLYSQLRPLSKAKEVQNCENNPLILPKFAATPNTALNELVNAKYVESNIWAIFNAALTTDSIL